MGKSNHKIFVKKEKLESTGLHPTSKELYDLMHLTSCEHADRRWKEEWSFCPVCLEMIDEDGYPRHKLRKDILV